MRDIDRHFIINGNLAVGRGNLKRDIDADRRSHLDRNRPLCFLKSRMLYS